MCAHELIAQPEHLIIFTIPVRIAVQMNIPLLIWGENSQNKQGDLVADAENNVLTRRQPEKFGGLLGFLGLWVVFWGNRCLWIVMAFKWPKAYQCEQLKALTGM